MKNEQREILGIPVMITGICETLAEAIAAAGSEQAVLNDYNANVLAHSHYTEVRKVICAKLAEVTGIKRLTKKHGEDFFRHAVLIAEKIDTTVRGQLHALTGKHYW